MGRVVKVRRTLVAEYAVPVEYYSDMDDVAIREMECDPDIDPSVLLDNVVLESVDVAFFDSADEAAAHTWETSPTQGDAR